MILFEKYRPAEFDDVVGQAAVVNTMRDLLDSGNAQSFLLSGPSGTGKTTLARIAASYVGCSPQGLMEIDAATYTGIDAMRQVQDVLQYRPMGADDARAVIVDECHALSTQAWNSLLKSVEKPPEHVYWFFCTTVFAKVPQTIRTRCASLILREVSDPTLEKLVRQIVKLEKIKLADGVEGLVVKEARGSPRQALVNLAVCAKAEDRKDAAVLLRSAESTDQTIELCRFLVKGGGSFGRAMQMVGQMERASAESVRIVVCNYISKAVLGARTEDDACRLLSILEAFGTPYNQSEGLAPLQLSIGRVLFPN